MPKFKRRSRFLFIILLILSMLTMGCTNDNTPEAKVDKLFVSAKKLDFEAMEEVMEGDIEDTFEEELDRDLGGDYEDFDREDYIELSKDIKGIVKAISKIKEFQSELDYEVLEVVEGENKATVTVDVNYVDGSEVGKKTLSTMMSRIFSDSISDAFMGAFSEEADMEDVDEKAEIRKYMKIAVDTFNESANVYETKLISNILEIRLNKDESGEWLISGEESDMVLFSALFFNIIDFQLIDQYMDNFS